MNKPFRIVLVVTFAVIVVVLIGLSLRTSRTRDALQRYQAELRSKGEKLSYEELTRSRSTNLNLSLATLTNAVRKIRFGSLNPVPLDLRKGVAPGQARVLWLEPIPAQSYVRGTSAVVTWEVLGAQMQTNRGALEEIRGALEDPAPDSGPRTGVWRGPIAPFIAIRTAGQWLAAAVIDSLHRTNHQDALQNLESLVSLARLNRDEYTLVSQMIRVAIARLGLAASWEALQAPDWTEAELQQLQQAWESIDLLDGLEKGFLGERALQAEFWAAGFKSSLLRTRQPSGSTTPARLAFDDLLNDYFWVPAYRLTSVNEDQLFYLKSMQQTLEGTRSLKAHLPWQEGKAGFVRTVAEIERIAGSPDGFRYWISRLALPNFTKAGEAAVRAETERQLTLSALALKRYQLRHGKTAPDLAALVPEFLSSVPHDCMSGAALRYRLKPDGTFLLYSVGEDGRDDGGDPTPPSAGKFDLWEGRDAVWPSSAAGPVEPPSKAPRAGQ